MDSFFFHMTKINLKQKFTLFNDHWSPKTIGELNGQSVKIAKVKGEFVWHDHLNEDELFMVVKGSLKIHLEDDTINLEEGELYIVPKGQKHKPVAEEECWIMLFEPIETKHTGSEESALTKNNKTWI